MAVGSSQGVMRTDPFGAQRAVGLRRPAHSQPRTTCSLAIGRQPLDHEVSAARGPDGVDRRCWNVQERSAVLAEKCRAFDIKDEVALLVGERDWSDQGGGVSAGQRDGALSGDVGAAAMAGGATVEGLAVAGGADFHQALLIIAEARWQARRCFSPRRAGGVKR